MPKEVCFFCGREVESKDGEFIEVMKLAPNDNGGMQVKLARWACNGCIAEYKEDLKDGEC